MVRRGTESHVPKAGFQLAVAKDGLELLTLLCLHLSSAGVTGMLHHTRMWWLWRPNPGLHTC